MILSVDQDILMLEYLSSQAWHSLRIDGCEIWTVHFCNEQTEPRHVASTPAVGFAQRLTTFKSNQEHIEVNSSYRIVAAVARILSHC